MIVHVIQTRYVGDFQFEVGFSDGRCGIADLRGSLNGPVFERLHDPGFFAQGELDAEVGTIVWPNGADIAPEYLYFLALRDDPGLAELFQQWGYLQDQPATR